MGIRSALVVRTYDLHASQCQDVLFYTIAQCLAYAGILLYRNQMYDNFSPVIHRLEVV
jgi:hypothetical protein